MPLDPDSFDRSPWTKTALASEHDSDEQEEILEKLQEYQEKLVHMETKNKQRVDKFRREIDTMIKSTRSSVSGPSWNRVAEPSPAKQFKGKGWRQDPILKAAAPTDSNMKSGKAKKKQKQRKGKENRQDQTGWATEDATDIQELGDFDFEGGLAKFDKRSVFAQLKEEDHIPSEERLVSHNRVARPGTFGGKNLHPTENVLDPLPRSGTAQRSTSRRGSAHKPSISSESSAESDNLVRVSSRISSARVPQKRFPIRTNTSGSNVLKLSRTGTGASGRLEASTHSIRHIASSTSNENISRLTPAASPLIQSTAPYAEKVHLFIDNDAHSICPTITPGVIVAVENLASSDHNLPLALINENAGRSLAEIIISELISRSEKEAKTSFSALFLVGNHRAGARALVAARHLTDRGVSSICCVLGLDRPGHSLNAEVDEQLSRIRIPETASANSSSNRSALIVVANWREVVKFLSHQTDEQDIWIDALLAPTYTYDTLVPDEQVAVVEMVEWANEGKLILSIDTPCGINASTGMFSLLFIIVILTILGAKIVTDSDDDILIYSHIIVSMGAPRTGLLNFGRESWEKLTLEGMKPDFDANIYVVDIGINETWKAYGEEHDLTAGTGVDFGLKWFVKVKVEEEEGPSDGAEEGYSNDGGRVW